MSDRCDLYGLSDDPRCVWCAKPRDAHARLSCPGCAGWGSIEGFDGEGVVCPTHHDDDLRLACSGGLIVNPTFAKREDAA